MEEENGTTELPLTNPVTDTPSPSVAGCLDDAARKEVLDVMQRVRRK
jgi:hypothetical protein